MITIATTNKDKYKKTKQLFLQFIPNLVIHKLYIKPEFEVKEFGKSEEENAIIKAEYYYKIIQADVIAIDDGIYFDNIPESDQPGFRVHRIALSHENPKLYWKSLITERNIKSGKLIKVFARRNINRINFIKVTIPVNFILTKTSNITSVNYLNDLMIPKGFYSTFNNLSESERLEYNEKYFKKEINQLFSDLIN